MRLVLNEKEVLNRALEEGVVESRPGVTIGVLAKHYFSIGQSREQVISSIDSFMGDNYQGYTFTKWQESIGRTVNYAENKKDFELVHIDKINVYKNEIETIRNIANLRLERLAFVLLVYARIYNHLNRNEKNWVNEDLGYVFGDTGMAVGNEEGALMVRKLYNMGLVQPTKLVNSTNIKVLFANSDDDIAIEVSDFRDIVFYYLKYIGDSVGNCEVCRRFIKLTSNRKKYCKECWQERERQLKRDWKRRYNGKVEV